MPKKPTPPPLRRIPRQKRSRQAVETIFEATARLMESHGLEALTTARIAEQAGYGVGTVYEYFPNKNAILITMARQELDKVFGAIQQSLTQAHVEDKTSTTQRVIRVLIRGFSGRQRLRGALLVAMVAQGHFAELTAPVESFIEFLRRPHEGVGEEGLSSLPLEQFYVLTRAVIGAIRAWSMEGGTRISPQTLEVELVRLAQSYIHSVASNNNASTTLALDDSCALPAFQKSE
ncbi:MAG: TetR/AcrR family transcriptional regulator [Cystobacterineae bacterium]|nr:TetR/AcrR family transcriptional regulator [Cystobacterineae bacterium]